MKKLLLFISCLLLTTTLFACTKDNYQLIEIEYNTYLDTTISVVVEYNSKNTKKDQIENELKSNISNILNNISKEFSATTDSTLQQIHNNAGLLNDDNTYKYTTVSKEFINILKIALEMGLSFENKYFNIAAEPLNALWKNAQTLPTEEAIQNALQLSNTDNIIIDSDNSLVYLKEQGMKLNFASLINGYTATKIKNFLNEKAYSYFYITVGNCIYTEGSSKYYSQTVEKKHTYLTDPFENENSFMKINVENYFISTISKNQNYTLIDGVKYSHIINPQTGYPTDNSIQSITVLGNNGQITDLIAINCYGMTIAGAMNFIAEQGFKAIIVTRSKNIYIVGNFEYELLNSEYKIAERK